MTEPSSDSGERRLLWLLSAVQLTLLLDFMIMMPLGPELMRTLRISPSSFGALVSSYTLASALAGLAGARWLDRFGRKRTLLALYGGFILATVACGAVASSHWLLVSRSVAGATAGLIWAAIMASVVDRVPPERRGRAIGTIMTSYAVSAVLGVPLGLTIAGLFSWRAPFFALAALASVLWMCLSRSQLDQPAPLSRSEERESEGMANVADARALAFAEPALLLGWALTFTVVFAGFLLIPYLGTFMLRNLGLSSSDLPWVYLCGGAATFFTSRWLGDLVDRHSPAVVLTCLLTATMVPHLLFTHLHRVSLPVVIAAFALFMTLTSGRVIPTLALITARVPAGTRGRFMAINTATGDVASGAAAWLAGALMTTAPDGSLMGFGRVGWLAVTMSCVALTLVRLIRRSAGSGTSAMQLTKA